MTTKQTWFSSDDGKPFYVSLITSIITLGFLGAPMVGFAETASTTPYKATPAEVEAIVRGYFSDIPVMIEIARCESRFRQFTDAGNPLDGGIGGMIGVYQIARNIHTNAAKAMGFDIDTVEGNLGYARYLYQQEGTAPWLSSFSCWNNGTSESSAQATSASTNIPASSGASGSVSSDLSLGTISTEVQLLQQILNRSGFKVASEGPGSPGQETTKYGLLTRDAVRKFQCAQKIVCEGDEYTTGYGFVGKRTRSALLTFAANNGSGTPIATTPSSTPAPTESADITDLKNRIANLKQQLGVLEQELQTKQAQARGN